MSMPGATQLSHPLFANPLCGSAFDCGVTTKPGHSLLVAWHVAIITHSMKPAEIIRNFLDVLVPQRTEMYYIGRLNLEKMAMFSGAVKLADLNDYLAPSQQCVKPLMKPKGTNDAESKVVWLWLVWCASDSAACVP